jgi:hypothetical protein
MRPPLHSPCTFARLLDADRMPLCRRPLLGRIFESKHISHSAVESARRACDRRRGRARAREALARGCARCVPFGRALYVVVRRASRLHAFCCCTCVSGRVSLGGFHI